MNYDLLAERLIDLQLILHASTINQAMSELDKGTFFALHYLLVHQRRAYSKEISHQMAVSTARVATLLNHPEKQGWIYIDPPAESFQYGLAYFEGMYELSI